MRKVSYIIALSLITVFLTGHFFIYKSVLSSHKKEFKAYIRSQFAKTEQIEISASELYVNSKQMTWLDENKEVCLNGIMYDIVSIKNNGTKVVLCVVNDKHEKELLNRYQNQFNDIYENGNTGKKNNNLIKDFLSLKFFHKNTGAITLYSQLNNYSFIQNSPISFGYLRIFSPPPKA